MRFFAIMAVANLVSAETSYSCALAGDSISCSENLAADATELSSGHDQTWAVLKTLMDYDKNGDISQDEWNKFRNYNWRSDFPDFRNRDMNADSKIT